jgi:hypothetical protein
VLDRISPPEVLPTKDQAFDEVERVSSLAASYARSSAEAAFRGDELTIEASLKALRLCTIHVIRLYNMLGKINEQSTGLGPQRIAEMLQARSGDAAARLSKVD